MSRNIERFDLYSIDDIKSAVDHGMTVYCDSENYQVIKHKTADSYLIKYYGNDYCIGLHGKSGTEYADKLNGSKFWFEVNL